MDKVYAMCYFFSIYASFSKMLSHKKNKNEAGNILSKFTDVFYLNLRMSVIGRFRFNHMIQTKYIVPRCSSRHN